MRHSNPFQDDYCPNMEAAALVIHHSAASSWSATHRQLQREGGFAVLETNGDLAEVAACCSAFAKTVVVIGGSFAQRHADAQIRAFLRQAPAAHLLVAVQGSNISRLEEWLLLGCSGFLFSEPTVDVWTDMMRRVPDGEMWVDPCVLSRAFRAAITAREDPSFSGREQEILFLLSQGISNKSVAARMFVTPATIRWHLRNLYAKTGVANRKQLMAYAARCVRSGNLKAERVARLTAKARPLASGAAPGLVH